MAIFIAEKSIPANSSSREGTERVEEGLMTVDSYRESVALIISKDR
jgi:hypothetical protein